MNRILGRPQVSNRARRVDVVRRGRLTVRHGLRIGFCTVTNLTHNDRYDRKVLEHGQADYVHATVTHLSNRNADRYRVVIIFDSKLPHNVKLNTSKVIANMIHSVNGVRRTKANVVRATVHVPSLKGQKCRVTTLIVRYTQNRNPRYNAYNNRANRRRISPRLQQR